MSRIRILVVIALVAIFATPSFAYTLYLKDGSTITCKSPHEERDGKAYFTYSNGNRGFLKLEFIDLEKTKTRNESDIGGASVIQEAEIIEKSQAPAPKKRTLSDMIRDRKQAAQTGEVAPPVESRPAGAVEAAGPVELPRTEAGFEDLSALGNVQLQDLSLAAEVIKAFRSQSVEARVYQGTQPSHPLVTVTANSEGAVLRAVAVAANALGQVRNLAGNQVEALELLISTPAGKRAGQFVITPEIAEELLSGQIEPTAFYVKNVQF